MSSYFIFVPKPSKGMFRNYFLVRNIFAAYVDSMAEGLSSVVTKLSEEIESLESLDEDKQKRGGDNSMNALGLFNSIRSFFLSIMMFLGGWVVTHTDGLLVTGIILTFYPALLVVLVIVFFKEERVRKNKS